MVQGIGMREAGRPEAEWGSQRSLSGLACALGALTAASMTLALLNRFGVVSKPPITVSVGLASGLGAFALALTSLACMRQRAAASLEHRRDSDAPAGDDGQLASDSRILTACTIAQVHGVTMNEGDVEAFYRDLRLRHGNYPSDELLKAIRQVEEAIGVTTSYEPKKPFGSPLPAAAARPTIGHVSPVLSSPESQGSPASPVDMRRTSSAPTPDAPPLS
jgi:hypothetical protein